MAPSVINGQSSPCKVDSEYEWVPNKCTTCKTLDHATANCPLTKVQGKRPVNVYVAKNRQHESTSVENDKVPSMTKELPNQSHAIPDINFRGETPIVHTAGDGRTTTSHEQSQEDRGPNLKHTYQHGKGKEIVVFNHFQLLELDTGVGESSRVLKEAAPLMMTNDTNRYLEG
ncbi:UNVERIFIED_CONTAM: hypothetical protein Slati_3135800 [Sesamum latifolium]|uniref:Uncharacterized protein n=1 Tax=Sesamum latifolium TaxID=2727402 RepID=A0AAW2UVF6_9LAMI